MEPLSWRLTQCWTSSGWTLFFASSSTFIDSLHSVSESKSESESGSVVWFGFPPAPLRHWSICVLKTFKSVVLTCLKHTGQVRLSDTELSQPDVDAWAAVWGTKQFSEWSEAVLLCAFAHDSILFWAAVSMGVITEALSLCPSSCALDFAAWSWSLLAWALWKKDCCSVLWPPSPCFFCAGGTAAKCQVWTEWLDKCSFSGLLCISWVEPLEPVLPGWRKPIMLFCRDFLSSKLTKAEIRTPTSNKTNDTEKNLKPVLLFHRSFRFIPS